MKKKQLKILLTKILPKFIILGLIVFGVIGYIGVRIWGAKVEKENKEWYSKPENQKKLRKAIEENENQTSSKSLKDKSQASIQTIENSHPDSFNRFKRINMIHFPIPYEWEIEQEVYETSIDFYSVVFRGYQDNSLVSIISQRPHKYIKDLGDYSEYMNEKIVRNMKPTGLILTSKKIEKSNFKGVVAVYEYFDGVYEKSGESIKFIAINMYYKEYAYSIFFNINEMTKLLIKGTQLI